MLRQLLWRTHTFPWRTALFLEGATARILLQHVGGWYSYTHRLLLDFFADSYTGEPIPSSLLLNDTINTSISVVSGGALTFYEL